MSNTKKNIQIILDLPGNRKCADCSSLVDQETGWASLNLGVVMCIQCASIHRAMGTHITKIRSFRLDTNAWTDKITTIFTTIGGNDRANRAVWESNLPSFWINPKIDKGSEAIRKDFVLCKYEKQLFLPPDQLRGRINNCLRKMPIEVRQIECDFWCRGEKKYKTKEFAVIHSRWLSRYNGGKKSKASQQIDLTNFNIIVEENTTGFEEYDGYEFSLYEDTKYIVDHTKEVDVYVRNNEQKSAHNKQSPNVFTHDEPLLRCRIKEFKQFVNVLKDIRCTMAYYRVYDSLFEIEPDDPPLDVTSNDLSLTTTKFLGFAKIGWSKRYFACINGCLYQFKEDISLLVSYNTHALTVWDLQIIDCVLDENGKRSGSKFAVLIINGNKTISLKFQSGPEAIVFFTKLKQCWTDIRGKYYVDFSVDPPEISGEASGPQPIQVGGSPCGVHHQAKSSFFMPNPQNGAPLTPPKEQDALILRLIEEYEKKQSELKKQSMNLVLDMSSTGTGTGQSQSCTDDGLYDDSGKFELSESDSDDALYRQLSRITSKEKKELECKAQSYGNVVNLDVPYQGQQGHGMAEDEGVDEDTVSALAMIVMNVDEQPDLYRATPGSAEVNVNVNVDMNENVCGILDEDDELDEVVAIEQEITMQIIQPNSLMDTQPQGVQNGYVEKVIENENKAQIYDVQVTEEPIGIVERMKATLENENKLAEPEPEPEPELPLTEYEIDAQSEPVFVKKAPIIISKDLQTYDNPSIDASANLSISALLRRQQQPQIEVQQVQQEEQEQSDAKTYTDADLNDSTNLNVSETEPEPEPQAETYNNPCIDDTEKLLQKQQQPEIQQDEQQPIPPEPEPEPEPEQKQIETEPEPPTIPEPSPEIVATTNLTVSSLLATQKQSEPEENNNIPPPPEPSIHIQIESESETENKSEKTEQLSVVNASAEVVRNDSSQISPRMSHTTQSQEVDSMAVAVEIDDTQTESEPEPQPACLTPNQSLSQKSYELKSNSNSKISMNKQGNVAARISAFNQKNTDTIDAKKHPHKNGATSTCTNDEQKNTINANDSQQQQLIKNRSRSRKRKRRRHKKKETKVAIQMAHLKITRWFNIDKTQVGKLNNPSFTNGLQQQLAKYGILSVRKDKRYIKVQISRRIPLPQRQNHWIDTIKVLQDKLQGSDLLTYETIITD